MRKLIPLLILLLCSSTVSLKAQKPDLETREAEWKSYSLPQTSFTRQVTADKTVVFRVPAGWKQEGTEPVFVGPHEAKLTVGSYTVAVGFPLTEYVANVLKATADQIGSTEPVLTRRTQFQDLEAREIFLEWPDPQGKMFRSATWITISGPVLLRISLLAPAEQAAALEPFFKATVQSVMFVPAKFSEFETVRSAVIETPSPAPLHEVDNIVAGLNQLDSDREAAINRLTPLFVSQPDAVVDLLVDRRALVRSAAAEALARSKNVTLKPFLWHVLDDSDPFVAEAAARRLGQETNVVPDLLNRSSSDTGSERIARVWPFLSKENRIKFMQGLFSQTAPDRKTQIGALLLLGTLTPDEFKFPLARILAANDDSLTIVALEVTIYRGDLLPVDSLIKLVASPNERIQKLAIQNLGQSAAVADISKLEALLSKRKALDDEINLSIKKIRFRSDLSLAKGPDQWSEIIRKASSDPLLDDFAFRFHCEISTAGCSPATARKLPPDFKVKPYGENLFPKKITHYTAIPNPGQTVQRFHQTFHGMQLDSPRAQANLILMVGAFRERLGQQLGAPPDAQALIDYTGIKPDSPIVFGTWTAAGARDSISLAQRSAIVLRVKDRERFERLIENYQGANGMLLNLTDYVAIGTRVAAALPAALPVVAQATLADRSDKPKLRTELSYSLVGQTEWNGIPIKSIEHYWINSNWHITGATTYLTFIDDVAILTRDLATLRDLLSNAATGEGELLGGNEEFRRSVATEGDIVYFSDLKAVLANPGDAPLDHLKRANESGALKFSNSAWENSHRFVFDDSESSKPLLTFQPNELSAPRDLLPSSTLAYFLTKFDVSADSKAWLKTLNLRENRLDLDGPFWALDFKKDVAPELGPECGAVLLELPPLFAEVFDATWAGFCKLKTNKLADALVAGKLFRDVGPTTDMAEIKSEGTSYFVGIKNGFLVVSNKSKALAMMGGKSNLAATRDYSRAAERVPAGIIAFGGYNLEAAVAAASAKVGDGLQAQMAGMIFSIASAFHSQSFFATINAGAIEGRSSVAMDREGRYAVADFAYLPRGANITFATLEPHGMPILDQKRLSDIVLKVHAKAAGPIDSIRDDIKSATQTVEQKSPKELVVTVAARRNTPDKTIELPVTNPEVAAFLKATGEIASDNQNVIDQARQIAGDDRDAWSVAQKLGDWTHKNLEWKSVARAGAAETLATREADCSEFSQLYVSMARSLGLPARIVSGLAYSGNSFGGHAWVEVWIGKWIELDPTWGTHFVDATHVRNEASTLVTAAALNLIDLEVLETRRTVAEFQKSPKALAEHVAKNIALADKSEVEAAFDLGTLTDEFMGRGAWSGLNEREREQMSAAYRRVLQDIDVSYGDEGETPGNVHLLHLEEKGDRAEALCYMSSEDLLLKLRLLRRGEAWYVTEVIQPDPGIQIAAERFGPVIKSIEAARAGKKTTPGQVSAFMNAVALLNNDDAAKALEGADRLLQTDPRNQTYRFLKMMSLWEMESEENQDQSIKLLEELSNEQPPFVPAIYRLAGVLSESKPEESIELYKRYSSLEPYDFRPYRDLARVYENTKQTELAEAAYRKAIALDPMEMPGYEDLAIFLVRNGRVAEVGAVLLAADKYAEANDDVLYSILSELEDDIKIEDAEQLIRTEAHRVKDSAWVHLAMSDIYMREKRYRQALALLKRAVQIYPELPRPHQSIAVVYLMQSRLPDALKAIDHALTLPLNAKSPEAHYIRASVLARLGRKKQAMTALEKSIELDADALTWIVDDDDLKSLRSLPAFQKLLREAEKQRAEADPK